LQGKDHAALKALSANKLLSGSSEIRNWIAVAAAMEDLKLDWISYLPGQSLSRADGRRALLCYWY
jgi:3-O-methylgallate 3,4-dioxygenase